jgi:lipoprotein-releasing system permease protein
MSLEWYIARRYLSSRRGPRFLSLITLIAMGGVFVGVMALIVVTAVMSGLQRDLRDKILGTNPHIWVTTYGDNLRLEEWGDLTERVRKVEEVVAAAPFVNTQVGLVNQSGYAEGAVLRGIDPNVPGEPITQIVEKLRAEEVSLGPTQSGLPPLLLGDALADRFGLFPGDVVTLMSIQDVRINPLTGIPDPIRRRFEVAGRFRTGMYEYDNSFVYTTLEAAQDVSGLGEAVSGLEVRVADAMRSDEMGDRITEALGGYPYRTEDWKTMNSSLFDALKLEKMAMGVILLLIVVVAAFNIISTLVMVVTDKTREIGILKSMGLRSSQVQRIFMLQGVVIGTMGSLLGAAMGLLLTWLLDRYEFIKIPGDVYFIDRLPVAFDWVDISVILILSMLISFVATIYPARQAARLYPLDAIRHE